ncbi:MAG: glycosyltransferase family 4 protein [Propionibacterium sp.]|nr:glycosyltransferase family 4 protein [Propionibacterium sp.]
MSEATDVSVVTSGHDVADARLHRLVLSLQRVGLDVEVLGLGDPDGGPQGCVVRTWERPSIWTRPLLASRVAAAARGEVIIALDPDSLVAARLRAGPGRVVVADVHEDYARLLADRAWARGLSVPLARALTSIATHVAARASLTLVADDALPPRRAKKRLVVPNHPLHWPADTLAPLDASPRAAYVGDLRASRGLFEMLDVIAELPNWRLDLVGPVRPSDASELSERLAGGLGDRVRLHGRQPPGRAWSLASGAWVGLALLDDTPAFRRAVPSKLYEYLAWGLVPVVSDLPRQREFIADVGTGITVDSVADAQQALRDLADRPDLVRASRQRGADWARRQMGDAGAYRTAAEAIAALVGSGSR